MKIAVFHCPNGVSAEGILQSFYDAGFPRSSRRRNQLSTKSKKQILYIERLLQRVHLENSEQGLLRKLEQVAGALTYFKIERCYVRGLGIGRKGRAHVLKLLKGFVLERVPLNRELVTPAGAAFLAGFSEKDLSIPAMRLESVGFGPAQMMVSLGETVAPYRRERLLILETNIDDMSPQGFELLFERLFEKGALDVWVEPILMKKTRPAFKLSILFEHRLQDSITETLFRETPTLGVRFTEVDRFSLPRRGIRSESRGGKVRYKQASFNGELLRPRPEYEDVKRMALQRNLSYSQAFRRAVGRC